MGTSQKYDFAILRTLRKAQGYTIADVSENSGISIAVISRIERNQAMPELETLARLAKVFGMSATDLLGLAEKRSAQISTAQHYHSGGFQFQNVNFMNLQVFLGSAIAGAKVSRPEVHHNDHEICWVVSGSIELTVGPDKYTLKENEAIQFDAMLKHEYRCLQDCKLLLLHLHKGKRM
jgi:mannose-6-phosphate isomerase-like protein (cupin superfamily)